MPGTVGVNPPVLNVPLCAAVTLPLQTGAPEHEIFPVLAKGPNRSTTAVTVSPAVLCTVTLSKIGCPAATVCPLACVVKVGAACMKKRSAVSLHGVRSPPDVPVSGIVSWKTYQPGFVAAAFGVT